MMGRLAGLFVILAAWGALLGGCGSPVPDAELRKLALESNPGWQNYQEDIKAQIGARAVAEWRGEALQADVSNGEVRVVCMVEGVWAARSFVMPILIQDPRGEIIKGASDGKAVDGRVEYRFRLPAGERDVPWVNVKYPNGEKRLVVK
jgi:hypothetical protein